MNTLKFEYLQIGDEEKLTPIDNVMKLAFERSVNILYEDHASEINNGNGRVILYCNGDGSIRDEVTLFSFPSNIPNYRKNISEIIQFIS